MIQEIKAVILASPEDAVPSREEREMRLAELKNLVREAEQGILVEKNDWKPVSLDPVLFELRVEWNTPGQFGDRAVIRLYFAEPDLSPRQTVVLLAHEKDISSLDTVKINALQDRKMREASQRYREGSNADVNWGLGWSGPIFP